MKYMRVHLHSQLYRSCLTARCAIPIDSGGLSAARTRPGQVIPVLSSLAAAGTPSWRGTYVGKYKLRENEKQREEESQRE